jgi:hypothetical protein
VVGVFIDALEVRSQVDVSLFCVIDGLTSQESVVFVKGPSKVVSSVYIVCAILFGAAYC